MKNITSKTRKSKPLNKHSVMGSTFYDVFHKNDNHYVIWCKRELMAIDAYVYPDGVEWHPYPYFQNTKFPFGKIEKSIRRYCP